MSSFPLRERPGGAVTLAGMLALGALAALIRCGFVTASLLVELWRGEQVGLTPARAIDLASFLPAVIVLMAFLELARAIDNKALYRTSLWAFVCVWLAELLRLVPTGSVDEDVDLVVGVLIAVCRFTGIGLSVWSGFVLVRLRQRLGGLAALLGSVLLLRAFLWVAIKVVLAVALYQEASEQPDVDLESLGQEGLIDQVDLMRALVSHILTDLVTFLFFLAVCDKQAAPQLQSPGGARSILP